MRISLLLLVALFSLLPLQAEVKPSSLFTDHMVLQRDIAVPVWGEAAPGERITVRIHGLRRASVRADEQGNFMLKLRSMKAGGPYKMTIRGRDSKVVLNDVYVGDVWLCSGQSNMFMTVARGDRNWCGVHNEAEEVANANFPLIRVFDVDFRPSNEVQRNAVGKWTVCSPETVGRFSAVAYFFGRDIYQLYKVPVGLITSSYGASAAQTWISREALEARPEMKKLLEDYQSKFRNFMADSAAIMAQYRAELKKHSESVAAAQASSGDVNAPRTRAPRNPNPELNQHNATVCYNGMIAPLIPYGIRGALWYQGESNGPTANVYREIMETLVDDWRTRWGLGDFPFLYVQLANYGSPMVEPVEHTSMMTVREAQLQNLSIPNTAMVVAIENAKDNPRDIHPKNKQDIGHWLALAARAKSYGERIVYSGPMYTHHRVEGMAMRLFFEHTGSGLVAKDGNVTGFAIRGEDGVWHWADARIESTTVLVWSPLVEKPVAVRYCWGTNPPASLHNREGLWTPHFRTDKD